MENYEGNCLVAITQNVLFLSGTAKLTPLSFILIRKGSMDKDIVKNV